VAYHGVDPAAFHAPTEEEKARVRARLGLGDSGYVAFLGAKEPRKNVPNLIRGWARAVADWPHPPALVLAGGQGPRRRDRPRGGRGAPHLRLLRPGYLRYADLPGFLGGALVACYPSFGEGFGLPILEAMACATPVLTTPRLSLPEVGGDAVAYTTEDPDRIAEDLADLLHDEPRRLTLAKAGFDRAKEFTWASSAEVHVNTWNRVSTARCDLESLHSVRMTEEPAACTPSSRPVAAAPVYGRFRGRAPEVPAPADRHRRVVAAGHVSRLAPVTAPAEVFVVTGVAHAAAVSRQLAGVPEENILVEPSPRDSCAAIALAAAVIARRDPEAIMGSFAADHLIADGDRFLE
jgi:hypothetical protein